MLLCMTKVSLVEFLNVIKEIKQILAINNQTCDTKVFNYHYSSGRMFKPIESWQNKKNSKQQTTLALSGTHYIKTLKQCNSRNIHNYLNIVCLCSLIERKLT